MPAIGLGCMRITELESRDQIEELIDSALSNGINFFDHADIYAGGEAEKAFGKVVSPARREEMILQTKCGIRQGMFDFSKEHILNSVEGSLKRLNTEYLDILLLHRPDTLMEPEEVAAAFDELQTSGKVRYFGVSNQNPGQMELLNKYCDDKIAFNQIQFSIAHAGIIESGLNVNMEIDPGLDRDGGILEYCRIKDITLQAWSPFQYGFFDGVFLENDTFPELNARINELAEQYEVEGSTIAIAWILRHPAHIQPIVGTTNKDRLAAIAKAADTPLTREEWYSLYLAAGRKLP